MNSRALTDWIQILTGIALLIGLVLVVLELQQNRELVRAQLGAEGFLAYGDSQRAFLGETFADTYAKACFEPESLTDGELVQMAAFGEEQLTIAARARAYQHIGSGVRNWEQTARSRLRYWLSTKVGRASYAAGRDGGYLAQWIVPIAEELIAKGDIYDCAESFAYFDRVRAEGDPLLTPHQQ